MNDTETTPRRPARLGLALKKGFRGAYDSLGYVVFATFVAFVCTASLFSLAAVIARAITPGMGGMLLFLPAVLVAYLAAVGIFYYVGKALAHEHPAPGDTLQGIRLLLRPALALFAVDLVITVVLMGDVVFFLSVFSSRGGPLFAALGVLSAYLMLMWSMMGLYHLPLLIAQLDMESGPRAFVILKKSFLLVADNPGFTVGLFVVIIAFAVLCALPVVGMAVLYLGVVAFLLTSAVRELFTKYGVIEEEPEVVEDKPWSLPESWRKRTDAGSGKSDEVGGKTDG